MNNAYDKWKKNEEWSKQDFINNLDEMHRQAVILGNLNYQWRIGTMV